MRRASTLAGLVVILALTVLSLPGQRRVRAGSLRTPRTPAQASKALSMGDSLLAPYDWGDQVPALALGASQYYLVVWESMRSSPQTGRDIYGLRVQNNGTLSGYPIPISTASGDQYAPDLAYSASSGYFLVVWHDYRSGLGDIYAQRVDSFGNLIGSEIVVCNAVGGQYYPQLAYNIDDGEWLVVWQDYRLGMTGQIYGQRIATSGILQGGNFVIASGTGTKIQPDVDYSITLHRYMVVWRDYRNGNFDIYGRRVQETGALEAEKAICTAAGSQTDVEVRLNGFWYEWMVVWTDYRNSATTGSDIRGRRLETDGDPTGSEIVIASGSADESHPTLVYNSNVVSGTNPYHFLVVWRDSNASPLGAIQARRVDDDGTLLGASFTVSAGDGARTAPAVYYDAISSSTYMIVWEDYRKGLYGEIFGQRVNDDTSLEGEPRGISKWTDQSDSALAYNPDDDEYLLVWRDRRGPDYDVWAQRLDGTGNRIGRDFLIAGGLGNQWTPDVAYSTYAGRYLIVWDTFSEDVWGQMVEADGTLYGGNFPICTATDWQWSAAVASSNSDKGFLVVWEDDRNGLFNSDIYGRRVSSTGTLLGPELLICTDGSNQGAPAIGYAPSSGTDTDTYLVVWYDERNVATSRDIYARPIYRTGTMLPETPVIVDTDNQEYPGVGYNSDDDEFLVVWQYRSGSTTDIYGRRVGPTVGTVGPPFAICTDASGQGKPVVDYSPTGEKYLVVWEDYRGIVSDIYGRAVTRAGALTGAEFGLSLTDRGQHYVDLAYGGGQDDFLVAWADDRVWWRDEDIYGRLISGDVLPFGIALPIVLRGS